MFPYTANKTIKQKRPIKNRTSITLTIGIQLKFRLQQLHEQRRQVVQSPHPLGVEVRAAEVRDVRLELCVVSLLHRQHLEDGSIEALADLVDALREVAICEGQRHQQNRAGDEETDPVETRTSLLALRHGETDGYG